MKAPENLGTEEWFRHCVQIAKTITENEPEQADYLTNLGILGGIILDYETIRKIIREVTMQESSVIQHFTQQGIDQGIEQGIREGTIEAILDVLEVQIQSDEIQDIKPILENIEEVTHLKKLLKKAAQTDSLEDFKKNLEK